MTYRKPTLDVLGSASALIQGNKQRNPEKDPTKVQIPDAELDD